MIAVHVTHEAVEKMGGIGAVIAGLVTSRAYQQAFQRTVLVGPLLASDVPAYQRLGPEGRILFSSLDDIDEGGWGASLRPVLKAHGVGIVYGTRPVNDGQSPEGAEVEVLLVEVFRSNQTGLNRFKGELFRRFGVPSDRFEGIWEYEEYVRLAEPAYDALRAIGCRGTPADPVVLMAHEYMGLPTALKAVMAAEEDVRTIFYAHEVASVRRLIETHPGHDLMFYNLLAEARARGQAMEDHFPEVREFFKHPLIKAARFCDAIFAVGDLVAEEMRFLDPLHATLPVEVVYNGLPVERQTFHQRMRRHDRLAEYAEALFGFRPRYVFTHVARPVLSKGFWRDLRILHELDALLDGRGERAVYFALATLAGQRRSKDVQHMERSYGWPVHHRLGYPDLCNGEETVGDLFEDFNAHHRAIRVVLVNQFGWERRLCGTRMSEEMTFADIRRGTDVEFGLSVYEPFGISQLEPLDFGGICVVSSVCGCVGLVKSVSGGRLPPNVLEADFTRLPAGLGPARLADIGKAQRDIVETAECQRVAQQLAYRLPVTDEQVAALLASGTALARPLSWKSVVTERFLPAVNRLRRPAPAKAEACQT